MSRRPIIVRTTAMRATTANHARMSAPELAAAVAAAPLSSPPRLHSACIEDRIVRSSFSCTAMPTTFWATSTIASQQPSSNRHSAIITPLTDHAVAAAAAPRNTVPPITTR
jgi:hypothetical protein